MSEKKHKSLLMKFLIVFDASLAILTFVAIYYNLNYSVDPVIWFNFWMYVMSGLFLMSIPVVSWFIIGGLFDLRKLFRALQEEIIDKTDDGYVENSKNHTH